MASIKKRAVALLLAVCMAATLGLVGCGTGGNPINSVSNAIAQMIEGDVTGQAGKEYATKWFTFTVNTMGTGTSFAGYEAASGNKLVLANITITNTFGSPQPFGTYDWLVDDGSLANPYWPMAPLNSNMMPENYMLNDGETVNYDVLVEYPANMSNPNFMYIEVDEEGNTFTTFKIPIV